MAPPKTRRQDEARGLAGALEAERKEALAALLLRRTALSEPEAKLLWELFPAIVTAHYDRVWGVLWR